jgi:hypothetical protein
VIIFSNSTLKFYNSTDILYYFWHKSHHKIIIRQIKPFIKQLYFLNWHILWNFFNISYSEVSLKVITNYCI